MGIVESIVLFENVYGLMTLDELENDEDIS